MTSVQWKLTAVAVLMVAAVGIGANMKAYCPPENPATKSSDVAVARFSSSRLAADETPVTLEIVADRVELDTKRNEVLVNGPGAMHILMKRGLRGEELAKPEHLTLRWQKEMFFDGKFIEIQDSVEMELGDLRATARMMQLVLKESMPLEKSLRTHEVGPPIDRMLADGDVRVESTLQDGARKTSFAWITGKEIAVDKAGVQVSGPGMIQLLQPNPNHLKEIEAKSTVADRQPKFILTRVSFQDRFVEYRRNDMTTYRGGAVVLRAPANGPDDKIDADHLPDGGLQLCGEFVRIYRPNPAVNPSHYWIDSYDQARVRGPTFYGKGERVEFMEDRQRLILTGSADIPVELYRKKATSDKFEKIVSRRILLDVLTDRVDFGQ